MKILIVQNTDWLTRYPIDHHHLAEKLSLRGHEIRVIDNEVAWTKQGKKELYSKREVFNNVSKIYRGAKVTVIRPAIIKIPLVDYISLLAISQKREINHQIREFAPDIVFGWCGTSYLAGKAAKRNNLPFINYWVDVTHRLIPLKFLRPVAWLMERQTLKLADKVVVVNDNIKDCVIRLGASQQQIEMLSTGADIEQLNPNTHSSLVRELYGLKKEDTVLLFMGWLYKFSGLKEVALQLAQIKDARFKLLIVGDGDAYGELQQIRDKYNLQDRLILTGKKPYREIPALIAASDICLLPAYPDEKIMQDIVPIKMYEYMAMRKPVIATRLPGVMKKFGEDNGVVYIDKPEDAVAKALELVQNGTVEKLGAKARSFVEGYSWDNITDEFERILEEAIKEKAGTQDIELRTKNVEHRTYDGGVHERL